MKETDDVILESTNEFDVNELLDSREDFNTDNIDIVDNNIYDDSNNITDKSNCLALTIKKDYNFTIIKNAFSTTGRVSLKVFISSIILNFLGMIL